MPQLFLNNARGTLAQSVSTGDTLLRISDHVGLPSTMGAGDYFLLTLFKDTTRYGENVEVVKVTAVTAGTGGQLNLTVVRGHEFSPQIHSAGEIVEARLTAQTLRDIVADYKVYADDAVAALVDSSPGALDTLNELAAALGDDPNFAATMTTELGKKLDKASYTAADVLAKLLTVDGPGSGLNADTLDGQHASSFASAGHTHDDRYVKRGDTVTEKIVFDGGLDIVGVRLKRNGTASTGDDVADVYLDDHGILFDIDNENDGDAGYVKFRRKVNGQWQDADIFGNGSGLTGTAPLRATGTTKGDVGLSNIPNAVSSSRDESSTEVLASARAIYDHKRSGDHDDRYLNLDGDRSKHVSGDWDNVRTTGIYRGDSMANACPGSHRWKYCIVQSHADTYVTQLMTDYSNSGWYFRRISGSTWGPWRVLLSSDDDGRVSISAPSSVTDPVFGVSATDNAGGLVEVIRAEINSNTTDRFLFAGYGGAGRVFSVSTNGTITGNGSGLTGTAPLRATGTTKDDVGLGNIPNAISSSRDDPSTATLATSRAVHDHKRSGDHDGRYYQKSDFTTGDQSGRPVIRDGAGDIRARLFRSTYTGLDSASYVSVFYTSRTSAGTDYVRQTTRAEAGKAVRDYVVDAGSNGNGRYIKFGSGIMFCWQEIILPAKSDFSTNSSFSGSEWDHYTVARWDYPQPFSDEPCVQASAAGSSAHPSNKYMAVPPRRDASSDHTSSFTQVIVYAHSHAYSGVQPRLYLFAQGSY